MLPYGVNFPRSLLEFSDTAVRLGIDNTIPPSLEGNLSRLSCFLADLDNAVAAKYDGRRIIVTSGYRCPKLNAAIGGAVNSDHKLCLAADTHVLGVPMIELAQFYHSWLTEQGRDFNQIILEFGRWVHISVPPASEAHGKRQCLTAKKAQTSEGAVRTIYVPGFEA